MPNDTPLELDNTNWVWATVFGPLIVTELAFWDIVTLFPPARYIVPDEI